MSLELPVILLTIVTGSGCVMSAVNIALYEAGRATTEELANPDPIVFEPVGEKRNIIYIILDRYADERTLNADYDYDNSEFVSFLRRKGFYVADQSAANYLKTAHSLSSSLNMEYHSFSGDQIPGNKSDWTPYFDLIDQNRVAALLKNLGYKYVHLGSWWPATATNSLEDENIQVTALSQFEIIYLREGILDEVLEIFQNRERLQCLRVPRKFERLNEVAFSQEPTFAFAHFLLPHDPYIFDRNGRCMSPEERRSLDPVQGYLGQLEYVNRMVTELVENIGSQPGLKPVVIVQADEGPFPTRYRDDQDGFQWRTATHAELRQKLRILNAYYFPGINSGIFYSHITPVNSFRALFNSYFDAGLPMLEDVNFAYPSDSDLYDFFDVTDIVR